MSADISVSQGELKTPVGDAPVLPLLLTGIGFYLMWFGVKYWRGSGAAVWPSYPIKSVLQGKGLPPNIPAASPMAQVSSYEAGISQQAAGATGGGTAPGGKGGPIPKGGPQNIARMLLSRFGWAASQMGPLILLWNRESGWNPNARNPSSGAYGIAQALGHGTGCSGASNGTNEYGPQGISCSQAQQANSGQAGPQILWGLSYIKGRYGSPAAAWQHETQYGWY